jgi:hypothetical protein
MVRASVRHTSATLMRLGRRSPSLTPPACTRKCCGCHDRLQGAKPTRRKPDREALVGPLRNVISPDVVRGAAELESGPDVAVPVHWTLAAPAEPVRQGKELLQTIGKARVGHTRCPESAQEARRRGGFAAVLRRAVLNRNAPPSGNLPGLWSGPAVSVTCCRHSPTKSPRQQNRALASPVPWTDANPLTHRATTNTWSFRETSVTAATRW